MPTRFSGDYLGSSEILLSGLHGGRLFIFGDNEPSVVVRDVFGGVTDEFPIEAGARPQHVVASTWNDVENALYAIDRAGPATRLVRWRYGETRFATVAAWPSAFTDDWRFWLNLTPDGRLLLTATRSGSRPRRGRGGCRSGASPTSTLLLLELPGDGTVVPLGARVIHERIISRPAVDHRQVQFIADEDDTIEYRNVRLAQLVGKLGAWTPMLKAVNAHRNHSRK